MTDQFTAGIITRLTTELRERIVAASHHQPICRESTFFVEATVILNTELGGPSMYDEHLHAWLLDSARENRETPRSLVDLMAKAVDTVAAEYGFTRK